MYFGVMQYHQVNYSQKIPKKEAASMQTFSKFQRNKKIYRTLPQQNIDIVKYDIL